MNHSFPSEQVIKMAAQGDEEALITLDCHGLLAGKEEKLEDYCQRILNLRQQYIDFEEQCKTQPQGKFEGFHYDCNKEKRIQQSHYQNYAKKTEELFGFSINWVPGFYSPMGILFGGCAIITPPNAFSLFFLRPSFARQEKWFLYSRQELMTHELSHVARAALDSIKYEELFAYQTSESKFRKNFGSIMRTQGETMLLMAVMLALLAVQTWLFFTQPEAWQQTQLPFPLPVFIIMLLFIGLSGFFITRQSLQLKRFRKLQERLKKICPAPLHFLFRLNDEEIAALEKTEFNSLPEIESCLKKCGCEDFRLKLLLRFFKTTSFDNHE